MSNPGSRKKPYKMKVIERQLRNQTCEELKIKEIATRFKQRFKETKAIQHSRVDFLV